MRNNSYLLVSNVDTRLVKDSNRTDDSRMKLPIVLNGRRMMEKIAAITGKADGQVSRYGFNNKSAALRNSMSPSGSGAKVIEYMKAKDYTAAVSKTRKITGVVTHSDSAWINSDNFDFTGAKFPPGKYKLFFDKRTGSDRIYDLLLESLNGYADITLNNQNIRKPITVKGIKIDFGTHDMTRFSCFQIMFTLTAETGFESQLSK